MVDCVRACVCMCFWIPLLGPGWECLESRCTSGDLEIVASLVAQNNKVMAFDP